MFSVVFNGLSFVFHHSVSSYDYLGGGSKTQNEMSAFWCEGNDAALKARPLRVQRTMMWTKRSRELAATKFLDLRVLHSRHQSFTGSTPAMLASSAPCARIRRKPVPTTCTTTKTTQKKSKHEQKQVSKKTAQQKIHRNTSEKVNQTLYKQNKCKNT